MTAKVLFTGKTHVIAGRNGAARSQDGLLDIKLPEPHPAAENLFGAAWSACYIGAIQLAAGQRKIKLPTEPEVDAEITLNLDGSSFFLRARLDVSIPGVERDVAQSLDRGGARDLPLLQGGPRQHRRHHHPRLNRNQPTDRSSP